MFLEKNYHKGGFPVWSLAFTIQSSCYEVPSRSDELLPAVERLSAQEGCVPWKMYFGYGHYSGVWDCFLSNLVRASRLQLFCRICMKTFLELLTILWAIMGFKDGNKHNTWIAQVQADMRVIVATAPYFDRNVEELLANICPAEKLCKLVRRFMYSDFANLDVPDKQEAKLRSQTQVHACTVCGNFFLISSCRFICIKLMG